MGWKYSLFNFLWIDILAILHKIYIIEILVELILASLQNYHPHELYMVNAVVLIYLLMSFKHRSALSFIYV